MKVRGSLEGFRSHRLEVYDMGIQTLSNALIKIDLFREGKLHYTDPEMLGVVIELEKAIMCMHELFLDSLSHVDKKYSYKELCTKIREEAQWEAEEETTMAQCLLLLVVVSLSITDGTMVRSLRMLLV
jgi:hypothetical protein